MRIVLSAIIWLMALGSYGQEQNRKNLLSLNIGTSYLARQDLIFSPMVHKDLSFLTVGLSYTREAKLFQKVILRYANFNAGVLTPFDFTINGESHTAYPHSFNLIDLDYLIGKKINESAKSDFTLGGYFAMDVQAMNYVYGRTSSFGYYSTLDFGAFGQHHYPINKKSNLTTTLQLPLIVWLARSPYLVNDDEFIENTYSHSGVKTFLSFIEDGQLVTWNKLQTFNFDVKYTYSLNKRWNFGAGYLIEFIHASQPRNLLSHRHSINLNSSFRF